MESPSFEFPLLEGLQLKLESQLAFLGPKPATILDLTCCFLIHLVPTEHLREFWLLRVESSSFAPQFGSGVENVRETFSHDHGGNVYLYL